MERRCRVCTLKEDDKSFRNLFGNRINFAEKLFYVASISVKILNLFNLNYNLA